MKLVENVFEIAESIMENSQYVEINYNNIKQLAKVMKKNGKSKFPIPEVNNHLKGIVLELVAASVNYCYWYGRYDIRPCGSSSTLMYTLLMDCFSNFKLKSLK